MPRAPDPRIWKWVGALQFGVIAATAVALSWSFDPQPHSDWLYYWRVASDPAMYERGGAGLLPLALLKAIGLSPAASALVINLASAAGLIVVAYAADRSRWRLLAQLVVAYLALISPFFVVVQLDLFALTLLAFASWLLLGNGQSIRGRSVRIGFLCAMLAITTKPQLALVLLALSGFFIIPRWILRGRSSMRLDAFVATMTIASVLGLAADYGARLAVGERDSMRTTSAVTLYSGLLVSSTEKGCGYWSTDAAEAAEKDIEAPLVEAVAKRLGERPLGHWMRVIGCKVPEVIMPPPYALYWLGKSSEGDGEFTPRVEFGADRIPGWLLSLEWMIHRALTAGIIAVSILSGLVFLRSGNVLIGLLPFLWILAFWAIHAVFEIQGRYFLPMFLLAPILTALAAHGESESRVPVRQSGLASPSG